MSAEAAVYRLLTTDSELQSLGINEHTVFPAHSIDSPLRGKPFLIIRWAELTQASNLASEQEVCTVWAHHARADSSDYLPLREILRRVVVVLCGAVHETGADGSLTLAKFNGMSANLDDPIFQTITKNAEFTIVTR